MTATHPKISNIRSERLCPTCGEVLVSGRCPECSPIEPARAYGDRMTMPLVGAPPAIGVAISAVDVRRTTGEWVTNAADREPMTRRAHPTLVRTALAEAEERARDNAARAALVTHVAAVTRPRHGSTSPRLRAVTPLPPPPEDASELLEPEGDRPRLPSFEMRETNVIPAPKTRDQVRPLVLPPVQAPRPEPRDEPRSEPRREASHEVTYEPSFQSGFELAHDEIDDFGSDDRRGRIFWIGLFAGVAIMLLAAAL